jgi:hypothetical protein
MFMKGLKFPLGGKVIFSKLFVLPLALVSLVSQSQALETLVNNNSSANIDPNSQAGMFNWFVDGQNQLNQQWFWYRIGSLGPESSINTISAPAIVRPDAKTAYITYTGNGFSVEVDYVLTGQTPGSGLADIRESIRIHNSLDSPLAFHFFQYSDFDLGSTTGNDIVQLGKDNAGLFNEALQTDGTQFLNENGVTPGANHGEAALFNATLVKLNDANPTTLNDNAGPVGPGDVTWALQWDFNIVGGGDALISKQKHLEVPEPSSLVLISLGAVAFTLHRRRQSQHGNPSRG